MKGAPHGQAGLATIFQRPARLQRGFVNVDYPHYYARSSTRSAVIICFGQTGWCCALVWQGGGVFGRFYLWGYCCAGDVGAMNRQMILKILIRTIVVAVAVGGPILFFSAPKMWAKAKTQVTSLWKGEEKSKPAVPVASQPQVVVAGIPPKVSPLEVEGPRVNDLGEVFRFDISTGWIMQRWSRVSTGMSQLQLHGYRVALVTGTGRDDLAGSLTYYFNPGQQAQTITFSGTTGDVTKLTRFLNKRYGFRRRIANDAGLFVYEVPGEDKKVHSVLKVRTCGILKANEPYRRFEVNLVLERPAEKK